MTRRSIQADSNAHIRISAGVSVRIIGWNANTVQVETPSRWLGMTLTDNASNNTIEVSFGWGGEVRVPFGSRVSASAGWDLHISDMRTVMEASAGHDLSLECRELPSDEITFSCGHDLRCGIRELRSAVVDVHDIGGKWQGRIGDGRAQVHLHAGGVATLVTDQSVTAMPPHGVLGNVERFGDSPKSAGEPMERASSRH